MSIDNPSIDQFAIACANEFAKSPLARGLESDETSILALALDPKLFLGLKMYNAIYHEGQAESVFNAMCNIRKEDAHDFHAFIEKNPWAASLAIYAAHDFKIFPSPEEAHAIDLKNIALKVVSENLFSEQLKFDELKSINPQTDDAKLDATKTKFFLKIIEGIHEHDKIRIASYISGIEYKNSYTRLPDDYLAFFDEKSSQTNSNDVYNHYIQVMPFEEKDFKQKMIDLGAIQFTVQKYLNDHTQAKNFNEGWVLPDKTVLLKSNEGQLARLNEVASQAFLNIQAGHMINYIKMSDDGELEAINNGMNYGFIDGIRNFFSISPSKSKQNILDVNRQNFISSPFPVLGLYEMEKLGSAARVSEESRAIRQDCSYRLIGRLKVDLNESMHNLLHDNGWQNLQNIAQVINHDPHNEMQIMAEISKPENMSALSEAMGMSQDKLAYYITQDFDAFNALLKQSLEQTSEMSIDH